MKYKVILTRTQILDERIVEAKNEKEAKEKAYLTFNKFDRDDYDDMIVSKVEVEDEDDE